MLEFFKYKMNPEDFTKLLEKIKCICERIESIQSQLNKMEEIFHKKMDEILTNL